MYATLCYGESNYTIKGYVNFEFISDVDKRKSTLGYVYLCNGAVHWVSKIQTIIVLSTTKV